MFKELSKHTKIKFNEVWYFKILKFENKTYNYFYDKICRTMDIIIDLCKPSSDDGSKAGFQIDIVCNMCDKNVGNWCKKIVKIRLYIEDTLSHENFSLFFELSTKIRSHPLITTVENYFTN